jgi:nicotinate-nucleotide adenylyltransferase
MKPIGIFGGTFDPIHYGHLRTAFELLQTLHFEEVRFIPCGDPPHRGVTFAPATLRLDMVRLATGNEPGFVVDDRELRREGPSYSVDTLDSLRKEFPGRSLCLITGMDAFLGLPTWHRWDEILDFAHIIVAHRPGWLAPAEGALGELLAERRTGNQKDLHDKRKGSIYVHAVTQLEIASTEIRSLVAGGYDPRYLMPDSVRDAIIESSCYTNASQ